MTIALLGIQVKTDGVSQAGKGLDDLSKKSKQAEDSVSGLSKASGVLVKSLGAMGVALGAMGLINMVDNWSDLNSRVRLAAGGMQEGADVMERLSDMARRTYSDLNQTTESYLSNATALRELGYNTNQTLDFTEALNNAFVVSGAKAQRAESVMNALSKAMAGGKLAGLELNTVIQTGGRVAELLAAELGTTVAGLRAMGAEGKITGDIIYKTMTKNLELLREEADSMPATIGDAFVLMRNSIMQNIGAMDQAGKVSESFAGSLVFVTDNLGLVIKAGGALLAIGIANYFSSAVSSINKYALAQANSIVNDRLAAAEKVKLTQAELAAAAARLKSAEAAYANIKANGLIAASQSTVNRELLAARIAYSAAATGAAQAAAAVTSMGFAATTASIAVSGLNAALNLMGGPVGAALLATGAAYYYLSQQAAEAEARSERYAEAIRLAGEDSNNAAGGIQNAAEQLFKLAEGATAAEAAVKLNKSIADQKAAMDDLNAEVNVAIKLYGQFSNNQRELGNILVEATRKFNDGKIGVEEYNDEIDRISTLNPSLAKPIAEIQALARVAAATTGAVIGLSAAINNLGSGKGGRLNHDNIAKARMDAAEAEFKHLLEFEKRYGDLQAKLFAGGHGKPEKGSGGGGKGKGKGKGSSANDITRLESEMKGRLDTLKQGFMSENELRLEQYTKDMETLTWYLDNKKMTEEEYLQWKDRVSKEAFEKRNMDEVERLALEHEREMETLQLYLDQKKITEEEYMQWKEQATAEHEEKIRNLRMMAYADALGATGDLMGSMAQVMTSGNDKMLKAQKIFGAAQALVSTYIGAAKALELGFPQNLAAMATVLAKGMSLVAAIKSGGGSSGGGGGSSKPQVSAAPPEQKPTKSQAVEIKLHGEVFTKQAVADLIGKINDGLDDGLQLHIRTA